MKTPTLILCALLLTACSSLGTFGKPGASTQDHARDDYECSRESTTYGSGIMLIFIQRQANEMYRRCMQARGWTETPK